MHVEQTVATRQGMHKLGQRIAGLLRAGDLVVLVGDLGAGKTTLTQGLAAGLDVRGPITSPTFVIARVHQSLSGGPALVHVDAYRLGSIAELDDLDLDASLDDSVTVVEWGQGLVEELAPHRLEVVLTRDVPVGDLKAGDGSGSDDGSNADDEQSDDEPRRVQVTGTGARWYGVELAG